MQKLKNSLPSFIRNNQSFFDNPLIQSFLEKENNHHLLTLAVEQGDIEASTILDRHFEFFYLKVRMIHYTNKLARFYGQTYDQKKRKQRMELNFDISVDTNGEGRQTVGELIPASDISFDDLIGRSVQELLPTKQMNKAFYSFSEQKKTILNLYLFGQFNNKEIAEQLKCTPQNVSKMKAKAFAQLKEAK